MLSDAESMYAITIYLRGIELSGEWKSSLLVVKIMVAPLKLKSIPHFELCGPLSHTFASEGCRQMLHIDRDMLYA